MFFTVHFYGVQVVYTHNVCTVNIDSTLHIRAPTIAGRKISKDIWNIIEIQNVPKWLSICLTNRNKNIFCFYVSTIAYEFPTLQAVAGQIPYTRYVMDSISPLHQID